MNPIMLSSIALVGAGSVRSLTVSDGRPAREKVGRRSGVGPNGKGRSMITIYTWAEAPDHYKALSDHGGDEDFVIVAAGNANIEEIMGIRHTFDTVVDRLDIYELGGGTVHTVEKPGSGKHSPLFELVYIIAHA